MWIINNKVLRIFNQCLFINAIFNNHCLFKLYKNQSENETMLMLAIGENIKDQLELLQKSLNWTLYLVLLLLK